MALVDTACAKAVAGQPWAEEIKQEYSKKGILYEIIDESEAFRFGPGSSIYSTYALLLPVALGKLQLHRSNFCCPQRLAMLIVKAGDQEAEMR